MDFGDLKDKSIQEKLRNFHNSINKIDTILEVAYAGSTTDNLNIQDQLNYDLFIAYMLNTLYWLYLRSKGLDPNDYDIKKENIRVKEYMMKARTAIERHTFHLKLDKSAAERFIRHAIKVPKNKRFEDEDVEVKTDDKVEDSEDEVQIVEDSYKSTIDVLDDSEDEDDVYVVDEDVKEKKSRKKSKEPSTASFSSPPQKKRRMR